MIPEKIKEALKKKHYAIFGHSAVQICKWTKSSLNGKGGCWKEKFYGIKSHRCCQFSPAVMWCENKCLHCWRPIEMNLGVKIKRINEPKEILDNIIKERKRLLSGFKGNKNTNKKKFKEALEPTLFTMSLSGEPTLYPKIDELIKEIRRKRCISFLVTNGQNPNVLEKLEKNNALPTQLTISLNAPNKTLFQIWHNSIRKDAWQRFNKSLELMRKLKGKTRRVIRLTLIKKLNKKDISNMEPENIKQYSKLIKKAEPDFIHVKGFKALGFSRKRIKNSYEKQPTFNEIKDFAEKLAKELKEGYKTLAEDKRSCVVLIGKDKKKMKIQKNEI